MKYYICLVIFLSSIVLQGKTLVLKINNPKPHIQVVLKDTVIWRGENNMVKVRVSGKYKIKRVGLKGGEVSLSLIHI